MFVVGLASDFGFAKSEYIQYRRVSQPFRQRRRRSWAKLRPCIGPLIYTSIKLRIKFINTKSFWLRSKRNEPRRRANNNTHSLTRPKPWKKDHEPCGVLVVEHQKQHWNVYSWTIPFFTDPRPKEAPEKVSLYSLVIFVGPTEHFLDLLFVRRPHWVHHVWVLALSLVRHEML